MANNSGGRRQDVIWLKFERTITPGKSGSKVNTHTNHSKLKIY